MGMKIDNLKPIEPIFKKEAIKMDIAHAEKLLEKYTGYKVKIVSANADVGYKVNIIA